MGKGLFVLAAALLLAGCVETPLINDDPVVVCTTTDTAEPVVIQSERAMMFEELMGGDSVVYFAFNSAALDTDAQRTIAVWAEALDAYDDFDVIVEGHCDERGSREYNFALGERRANAIRDLLISMGIDGDRIGTISYGKERPAVSGHDPEAWALNRRGVVILAQ